MRSPLHRLCLCGTLAASLSLLGAAGCSKDEPQPSSALPLSPIGHDTPAPPPDPAPINPSLAAPALIQEINLMRQNPPAYASVVAQAAAGAGLAAAEPAALAEAMTLLKKTKPLTTLALDSRLQASALAHVADIGPKGLTSHNSSNGESFAARIQRFLPQFLALAETMAFGIAGEQNTVCAWLIDAGVPGRTHRAILLDPRYNAAGAAAGPHATAGSVATVDLAEE